MELSELEDLRKFHYHTLKLYCALCALGNTRVAHALCSHLDQSQLLYTIDNQYLSGMLREGFYNVLIRSVYCFSSAGLHTRFMLSTFFIRRTFIPMSMEKSKLVLSADQKC